MAEPLRPTATKTYGKENWIFVTAASAVPTAAEVTATSGLDITRIAFASGTPTPTQSTNLATQERRFGDTTETEFVGTTKYSGGEIVYQFAPQAAAASDGKKAWETFPAGTTGFLIRRQGVARATAPIAGQFVDVYPVEFGPSMPTNAGDGESTEAAATCTFAVTDAPTFNVAIAV